MDSPYSSADRPATGRPTDRPTGRQAERQTDTQKDRQTDRQTGRKTDRETDRQTSEVWTHRSATDESKNLHICHATQVCLS